MLLWDSQSCIPFLKIIAWSRAEKQVRKRQAAGVWALGLHRAKATSALWSTGVGAVSPVLLGSRNKDFVSELNCIEEHWPFYLWLFFLPWGGGRGIPALSSLWYSKFSVRWQQHWYTPLLLGLLCRAWAPGNPLFQIPYKHEQSFSWFAGYRGLGLSHSRGCTFVMAYPWEGAHVAKSRTAKSRGVHTAAWTSWASVLGGMRYKSVSERGAGFGGRHTDRAAETDRSWKQTHRSASACLCSAKRHLQSLDHDGCNLLCWNFSIHRLTVQRRKIIYLMRTYLLQCPSNHRPSPSSLQLYELVHGSFQYGRRAGREIFFVRWPPKCNTFN